MNFKQYIAKKFKDAKFSRDGNSANIRCINKQCEDYWKNDKHKLGINFNKNVYNCFRCGFSGKGMASFIEYYEGIKINAASINLGMVSLTDFKLAINEKLSIKKEIVKDEIKLPSGFTPVCNSVMALNYLKTRGIDKITAEYYKLGFTIIGDYAFRIIFPSYNEEGKLIYFSARSIFPHFKKVMNADIDKGDLLYGLDVCLKYNKEDYIVVVEGAFDCITIGFPAIALYSKNIKKLQFKKLCDLSYKKYYIMLDGDAREQALDLCSRLYELDKTVYLVNMDYDGDDPNDLGREACFEKIKNESVLVDSKFLFKEKIGDRLCI